jgi:galactokinase/mevalonate kinase-like predicted kinase
MPGLNRHYYDNTDWPSVIETITDETILSWLENKIYLVLLWPRPVGTNLLKETYITKENVRMLTEAADITWEGILKQDFCQFAEGARKSFEAQVRMFPAMFPIEVQEAIEPYIEKVLAWKLAGAGGGGYLALFSEKPVQNAIKIKIRRKNGY